MSCIKWGVIQILNIGVFTYADGITFINTNNKITVFFCVFGSSKTRIWLMNKNNDDIWKFSSLTAFALLF